ncbi:uncharacterized protein C8orf48-like [Antechinus flavipes]|uniref:uncharacterized protein C8orf48-like n=1 Tax=Antechinus flavipes TaxID=38775 RepID=UPI00223682DE|nr:uncharacterized protein C8orf48-like [Antechinus flavipes]
MPYVVPGGASPEMPRDDSPQSQAEDSSVPSNYSSESFESFTEKEGEEEMVVGEEEKCHPTQRKPCGSLVASDDDQTESSASGSHSVSKWLMPSSKDEDEPLDPLDSAALQEKLSQRWIQHLKAKESANGQPRAGPTSHADVTEASKSERDAVQAFCATKINLLRRQLNSRVANGSGRQRQPQGLVAEKPVTDEVNDCVVPHRLINRISQQNLRAAPSQVSAVKKHDCSRCPECTKKRAELSQLTFVRQKKTFLESALLKEKMDEYRHTKDFLSFIGEIHKSLPRLSDDPETIWKRLNARGQVE